MDMFLVVLSIVWSVLCIILFFKVWGMCNDVAEMKDRFAKVFPTDDEKKAMALQQKSYIGSTSNAEQEATEINDFKVGDSVIYEPMNRRMIIKRIGSGGLLQCVSYKPDGKEEYEGTYKPEQVKKL
jgi:hypothetical protein